MESIKLIAFDLDGVLVDGCGSWREVHKGLGTYDESERHAELYYSGEITFDEWARIDAALWEGIEMNKIRDILYGVRLMRGADEAVPSLKERYKLVIISGGLQTLADRIKDMFNMDYAIANRLLVEDGRVAGIDQVVDFKGKGRVLAEIAGSYGLEAKECAVIGDYVNDIPMFRVSGFSIAFNPKDKEVIKYADEVIYENDLTRILPFFEV